MSYTAYTKLPGHVTSLNQLTFLQASHPWSTEDGTAAREAPEGAPRGTWLPASRGLSLPSPAWGQMLMPRVLLNTEAGVWPCVHCLCHHSALSK